MNSSGAATAINTYDEYGQRGGANTGRFQYTGQPWLPEVALYHYRARAYSPALGRFMQTDPILHQGGMNLYAYVGNDPVSFVDPSGLQETLPPIFVPGKTPATDFPRTASFIATLGKRPGSSADKRGRRQSIESGRQPCKR